MAEVTQTVLMHDGVIYPVDTPVTKIKDLTDEQAKALRDSGAIAEPVIPESVKSELEAALAEVELLKAQLADAEAVKVEKK